jgi:UDP-N-acetyl-2-amino-2-deoxyglucuronate dehydrogenase
VTGAPRPFRFGLIGAGVAAEIHVAAMRTVPGVEVHAIADVVPERARALAARYDIPEVHESGEALASRAPVDAVAVLTPHHLHLPYVLAAASAGRHVLVEKAIAHTVAAADELIDACRTRGITLGGIFQNRFTPAACRLREAVAGGGLGRVFLASVTVKEHRPPRYFLDSPWRGRKAEAGGGVLMIQAIHMIDLLLWVLGMPRRVVAQARTVAHDVEVEDVAVGLLEFEAGVMAALQATTVAVPGQPPSVEIHGDRGTATVSGSWGHLAFRLRTGAEPGVDIPSELRPTRPSVEPHVTQISGADPRPTQPSLEPSAAQVSGSELRPTQPSVEPRAAQISGSDPRPTQPSLEPSAAQVSGSELRPIQPSVEPHATQISGSELRPIQPSVEPYAAQIADFVAAIREGRPPLVDGAEARKALVVVEALYRSASTGRWVTVDSASSEAAR